MKKIVTIGLFALATHFSFSQDGGSKWRFGLKLTPSVNWLGTSGNIISGNGAVPKIGGGLIVEYKFNKIVSLQTGLQIDFCGGNVKYNNGTTLGTPNANFVSYWYNSLNNDIVKYSDGSNGGANTLYQLDQRNYNMTYITVPICLKMKTKEIGSLTYYGQFGINNSFRWNAFANDNVQPVVGFNTGTAATLSKIDVTNDVSLYMAALNIGAGVEMNLSGTTSLTFGINYIGGFTNFVSSNSQYLERQSNNAFGAPTYSSLSQQLNSNMVQLLVGVLF